MEFEAQKFTEDTLKNAELNLKSQGQIEGYTTHNMIQRATEDSNLTPEELSQISAEILYDVNDVCQRSHNLCEELKDQIFINRLKKGITLSVNGNGAIMDEGLFQKHFGVDIVQLLEEHNGGWAARMSGYNNLEIGDIFTAVLHGDNLTFFNGDNEAEFSYDVNSRSISRKNLEENDKSDDSSILDIDMEVDGVIKDGVDIFSGSARDVLLDPAIKKDFSRMSDEEIITLSNEIGMKEHILTDLRDGEALIAHSFMSDEDIIKIAGLLSVEDPNTFLGKYNSIKNIHIAPSILIIHDADSVSFIDNKGTLYGSVNRI